jgi:hypothetical protein
MIFGRRSELELGPRERWLLVEVIDEVLTTGPSARAAELISLRDRLASGEPAGQAGDWYASRVKQAAAETRPVGDPDGGHGAAWAKAWRT